MNRLVWLLLLVVAAAAAVLSFAALRDLALLCGFTPALAWLLPVVIDAGAAVGCLVWLGRLAFTPKPARRFARTLTWSLLAGSVAGNAIVHGLTTYAVAPPWWLVVAVSGVAPAVLGAVVHLAVQLGHAAPEHPAEPADEPLTDTLDEHGLSLAWTTAPPVELAPAEPASTELPELVAAALARARDAGQPPPGRRRLAAELSTTEHAIRAALAGVTR